MKPNKQLLFDKNGAIYINEDTSKEDELFEYISYYKPKDYEYTDDKSNNKDFDINL